ncbi:MAG: carboxypeptidase-like regulatory domain-containing protein [Bacteroidetes bacterium]|nr:MAG: carboxypeptidase-like regulatory domain-containing protein [Bacteroidota bacterium]
MVYNLFLRRSTVFFILAVLSFLPCQSFASEVRGRITDAQTGEPLAFVHILIENSQRGTMTDIDGYFSLELQHNDSVLRLSYVGYFTKLYRPKPEVSTHFIALQSHPVELAEVVVYPGENPAHRIVLNAIENRRRNNPQRLSSFSYTSYNKLAGTLDRNFYLDQFNLTGDSVHFRMAKTLEERHLFLMESVTERKFRYSNLDNEKVVANRVSGLQNPLFTMLVTELQSFSFYDNYITLLGNDYLSPLNRIAFSRYSYHLKDTLYQGKDSVFVISFKPLQSANFEGLQGLLYIHTDGWAIQNVIARPLENADGGLYFRIQQKYERPDRKHWFPAQLNTDIEMAEPAGGASQEFLPLRILGRSYITDVTINPPLIRSDFSVFSVDFDPGANEVSHQTWELFRFDTLSVIERNTYRFMDSLGKEHNFERILNTVEPLIFGELPMGRVNLMLNDVYRINSYEGHRIGIGLQTNRSFSSRTAFGGYYAWGTRDKQSKYGYFGELILHKANDLRLGGSFSLDVTERGSPQFFDKSFSLVNNLLLNYYSNVRDLNRRQKVYLNFRLWQNFIQGELSATTGKAWWDDFYFFKPSGSEIGLRQFRYSEAALRLRFVYGEILMNTPLRVIHLPSRYPVLNFNIIKGFDNVAGGEFDYLKLESKLTVSYPIPLLGIQNWMIEAGWVNRTDIPWPLLFTANAADRRGWLAAPFNFGTMDMNEFMADRFVAIFFQHNFQSLLFRTRIWQPELLLISNLGWGSLRNTDNHIYPAFRGWEKGYFESGIAINKILPQRWIRNIIFGFSPGVEILYRYGPYSFENHIENLTLKLNLQVAF